MTSVTIIDNDGCPLVLKSIHGILLSPKASLNAMTQLEHMQCRDDDVIVCGYVKTGTNWMFDLTWMLLQGSEKYASFDLKVTRLLEFNYSSDAFHQIPSPRLFATHLPYDMLPPDLKRKRCKIIYMMRNPKDVAVSLYNHLANSLYTDYKGTWNEFLTLFLNGQVSYGNYFDHLKKWNQIIESENTGLILPVYYEDMKRDFKNGVRKLCDFLQVTRSQDDVASVSAVCEFENMKLEKETIPGTKIKQFREGTSFYRKGVVGDWKNWFTEAQNERFDKETRKRMEGLRLRLKWAYTI